ncbi:MAG: Eco57I restriction-modification methylase domain-containing protein [Deltaproteobacteria bacterium]|nr:Eco57I restriction-modification methylase domain-containing protein [Deltaproteobacteria bacterium]
MRVQQSFNFKVAIPRSAYEYGERNSGEIHGVVLTKPHVVELILDLIGYDEERELWKYRLLEPSCGHGAFITQAATRLLKSAARDDVSIGHLKNAIVAFDIDPSHVRKTKSDLVELLTDQNVSSADAEELANTWVRRDDFLLSSFNRNGFDFVIGNPPYVRIENIADVLQAEYRSRFRSLYDRADLYVAFIEKGLQLLNPNGALSFVCSDRWTSNKYGKVLREIVTENFAVKAYIDLHQASPFESDVIAYPSIFLIERSKQTSVAVYKMKDASPEECENVSKSILGTPKTDRGNKSLQRYTTWFRGEDPWVLNSPAHLEALRLLEEKNVPIEADGKTHVSIGVATGADAVYILDDKKDIEEDRLVPLVMRKDIENGKISDAGRYVINTFAPHGGVVNLGEYPRLRDYLTEHRDVIMKRHVAQKNPSSWFRTIDKIHVDLVRKPKLLIPDIAGANEVAIDDGKFYPHHNLYYVVSDAWDISVLGGLLSSRVALFFIWSYATKMRGDYLRFQAQYLRRIRVPDPLSIPNRLAKQISHAFYNRDFAKLDALSIEAYGIDQLPEFDFVDTRR